MLSSFLLSLLHLPRYRLFESQGQLSLLRQVPTAVDIEGIIGEMTLLSTTHHTPRGGTAMIEHKLKKGSLHLVLRHFARAWGYKTSCFQTNREAVRLMKRADSQIKRFSFSKESSSC